MSGVNDVSRRESLERDDRKRQRRAGNINGGRWEAQQADSFGFRHLEAMGWQQGRGIGAKQQGTTAALSVKKLKADRGLQGRADERVSDAWIANVTGFAGVLAKLNARYAEPARDATAHEQDAGEDDKKSKKKKKKRKKEKEKEEAAEPVPVRTIKTTSVVSQKRFRAKNMRSFSTEDLQAIMGGTKAVLDHKKDNASGDDNNANAKEKEPETVYEGMFVKASTKL